MKSTGMIRRIDDLGRVVIPKEIRKHLDIREGDPLEIFIESDGVTFRRYDETANVADAVNRLSKYIESELELPCQADLLQKIKEMQVILEKEGVHDV